MIKPKLITILILLFGISVSFAQSNILDQLNNGVNATVANLPLILFILAVGAALIYSLGQAFGAETRAKASVWATSIITGVIIVAIIYLVFIGLMGNLTPAINNLFVNVNPQYIIASLLFSIGLTALFYLAAYVLQSQYINAIAKEELAALILTFIIVGFWGFFSVTLSKVSVSLICTTSADLCMGGIGSSVSGVQAHVVLAEGALDILLTKLSTSYSTLYLFEVLIGFLSTVSFPIGSPLPAISIISFSFMPYEGMTLLSNAHTIVVETIGYLMMVVMAKQHLLSFAKTVPVILLPVGLFLRAFPWFRTTGSSLIAICIVAYFVYPFALILSNYLIFDLYKPSNFVYAPEKNAATFCKSQPRSLEEIKHEVEESQEQSKEMFTSGNIVGQKIKEQCGSGLRGFLCSSAKALSIAKEIGGEVLDTVNRMFSIMWRFSGDFLSVAGKGMPLASAEGLYYFIVEEVAVMSQFVVLIIMTSVIEIIISITMYRNIASLIGGEVEIAGLSKLV